MKDKTGRLVLKVIFIAFALILIIFSSIIFYQTAEGDAVLNLTKTALKEKDYNEIFSLFGGIYSEKTSIDVSNDDEENHLIVIPSCYEEMFYYYPLTEDDTKENHYHHQFVNSYSFFIFNPSIETNPKNSGGDKVSTAGINFILNADGEEKTYNYPFVISAEVNTTKTFDEAVSVNDYLLNYKRDIVTAASKYGFYYFSIPESLIQAIEEENSATIVGFNIVDRNEKNIYDENITFGFDYDDSFFADDQSGVINSIYKEYIPYYDSYKINSSKYIADNYNSGYDNADIFNAKTEEFNNKVEKFLEDLQSGEVYDSSMKMSKQKSDIVTNSVIAKAVWRTIGIEALILLVVAVIYLLLFHFQQLRDFIFRNDRRTPIRPKVVNKEPVQEKNKFNYDQTGNKKAAIDAEVEEVKEDKIEE